MLGASANVLGFFGMSRAGSACRAGSGSTKAYELLSHVIGAGGSISTNRCAERILQLEEIMRKTSICGLGQVALGPVVSVLGLNKGARRPGTSRSPGARPRPARPVTGPGVLHRPDRCRGTAGFRPPGARRWRVPLGRAAGGGYRPPT